MTVQRAYLNDKNVFQFPLAAQGRYVVRDDDLRGFFLIVGRRCKSYMVQSEHWSNGKRVCKTVLIGHAGDVTTREARLQVKLVLGQIANGELDNVRAKGAGSDAASASSHASGVTLRQAWARYLPGVNAGCITRAKLLRGHLRATQETLSKMMIDASSIEGPAWPFLAARKLGDPVCDPTPPEPRSKRAREEHFWALDAPRLLKAAMRQAEPAAASQPSEHPPTVTRPQTTGETEPQHQPQPRLQPWPAPPTPAPSPPHHDPVRSLLTM